MTSRFVLTEKKDKIGYLILNRPEKLNALSNEFILEIIDTIQGLERDTEVRVIVIKARGRAFSAGGDLSEEDLDAFDAVKTAYEYKQLYKPWAAAGQVIRNLSKPTIVQVQGYCLAGATDVFLHSDFILCAEDAQFGCPDVKGMEAPCSHIWTYLMGPQWAKYVLLTGDKIDGKTAERIGLAMKAVPLERLEAEVDELAHRIARIPVEFLEPNKSLVNKVMDNMGYLASQQLALEASAFTHMAPAAEEFHRIRIEKGMKAALAWRAEQYG